VAGFEQKAARYQELQHEVDAARVWLVRRDGELSLNDRDDLWTPARLAAVGNRPHRRGTPTFS